MRPWAAAMAATMISMTSGSVPLRDAAPLPASAAGASTLPAGWRWESFGGLEVGVPGDWGHADTNMRLITWCAPGSHGITEPVVGRPGRLFYSIGCRETPPGGTPLEKLISNTGWVVGFRFPHNPVPDGVEHDGDRTTVRRDGVEVAIQVPPGLREQIAATVRQVRVDHAGCPVTDPISTQPLRRPTAQSDVTRLRAVTAVAACKYQLASDRPRPTRLTSSVRLEGRAAADAIRRIAQSPAGEGPDELRHCGPDHGDEAIVLRVWSAGGQTEIVLRYSGCVHNRFDDGVTTRRLTAAAVAPFVTGANVVRSMTGPKEKVPMVGPR